MTPEDLDTLRAAVRIKLDLPRPDVAALIRGLPRRHAVEFGLTQAADFILIQFASGASETTILERDRPGAGDKLREDQP